MSQELVRLMLSLLATLLLAREAMGVAQGPQRRLAFRLATTGFALLTLGNLLAVFTAVAPPLLTALVGAGLALLLGSLASLFLAYRAGELNEQFRRVGSMIARERDYLDRKSAKRGEAPERDGHDGAKK